MRLFRVGAEKMTYWHSWQFRRFWKKLKQLSGIHNIKKYLVISICKKNYTFWFFQNQPQFLAISHLTLGPPQRILFHFHLVFFTFVLPSTRSFKIDFILLVFHSSLTEKEEHFVKCLYFVLNFSFFRRFLDVNQLFFFVGSDHFVNSISNWLQDWGENSEFLWCS